MASQGGSTGNFEGGKAMGSLGGITGRDHWAGSPVRLRAGKLGLDHWAGSLVSLSVENPWDHWAGSLVTLRVRNPWDHLAGWLGGITGNFEGG